MADFDDRLSVTLPDALRQQFAQVEQRLWRVETTVAVCAGVGGLVVSFLALFVSDRLWNTPEWLRLALLISGLAVAALAGLEWARRWLWRRRDLKALANLVQRKYRRLGDRLLGIVELANEERHFANFSPALYHAAIYQVAEEAKSYDFRDSVSTARARKSAFLAGTTVVFLLLVFVALPGPGWNAFLRWAAPMAGIPRYTLVRLEGLPSEMIVAHGEGFDVSGAVQYRSFWKPRDVFARWGRQPRVEGKTAGDTIHVHVPGQVEDGVLRIELGDASAEIKVSPIYRPSLEQLTADIQLPDYLKYPAQTNLLQNGALLMVEGSRVAFRGKVSRPLSTAMMQTGESAPAALTIAGENFSTDATAPDGAEEIDFNWRDKIGLSNAAPMRVSIRTEADAPPTPEIVELPREIAVLVSDVLHVPVQARDDFGVRDFGLMWDMTADSPRTDIATTEIKTQAASPRITSVQKVFLWSPSVFRIPADSTVELQGYARDYYPDRERSMTPIYRVHVLSPEQHAELVREQLEAVMEQVEDVTRLQEKIVANLSDVKDAEKMPDSQKSARIGQSKADQLENADHLNELSKQGERAVREAMKNPIFNAETIRQWSQSMDQWRQLSGNKMQDAAKSMQAARQGGKPQSQEMADATQKAEDILKQLEKMEGKANEHMDDLQALTLSQRLRKVGSEEKDIGGMLVNAAPETIGLLPRDLPEKYKVFDSDLTRNQDGAQKETSTLQGEISRFFERTQKPGYGEVSKEMASTRAADELDRVSGLIGDNIGIEASENLGQWSERFQKWSEKLEPKSSPQGQSSGSGSSGKKKDDLTEQLIALLRLRESEMNLRDQTSVLDQDKGRTETYSKRAAALSQEEEKLTGTLEGIHQKTPIEQLDTAFAQASGSMKKVTGFLGQPETGKAADEAEVGAIESISDLVNLINEQAQRPNPQQSKSPGDNKSDEEMQFLLQMMRNSQNAKAMSARPATGLNHAGGTTDRAGRSTSGNAAGKGPGSRSVRQAAGSAEESPTEFRDAMENYYHGIEQGQ
ncbi:MAG TPA: hypothetical protein VH619_00590 [Verrucomicrobiae bacterium]|nr:hypothetical protein [Verrucomicrobiae bacterium]